MGDQSGDSAPYVTACLIYGLAELPQLRPYVHGKLAMAGVDLRAPAGSWLDAVYAIVAEAPHDRLDQLMQQLVMAAAKARPDRDTWGMLPEHQALMGKLTGGARGTFGAAPPAHPPRPGG